MRIASGILCVILLLFAVVQVNDPDPLVWGSIYGIAALWCGIATFRPRSLARAPLAIPFAASLAGALFLLVRYWPTTPRWWSRAVWWETEAAREGMGVMIVAAALILCAALAITRRGAR